MLISLIIASATEGIFALYKYQKAGDMKGKNVVSNGQVFCEGIEKTDAGYVISKEGGRIVIELGHLFVNKFDYSYSAYDDFNCNAQVSINNGYGNESIDEIIDEARTQLTRSSINIADNVSKITMEFNELSEEIVISQFWIDNSFKPSPIRAMFFAATIFLMGFLWIYKDYYKERLECAFAVSAFVIGIVLLIAQPPHGNAWDEHIHFANCYIDPVRDEYKVESEAGAFLNSNPPNFERPIQSIEERIDEIRYLNNTAGMPSSKEARNMTFSYDDIGYIFQILVLKIGTLLNLPFYCIWILGKFTNLILYCALMYYAIKIIPIGKNLITIIGLLPTTMILTASYTYDITVTACVTLAMAIIIKAFYYKHEKMSRKELILFCLLVVIASCPKRGVYLPLILLILFLSSEKFGSKKEEHFWKGTLLLGIFIAVCLVGIIVLKGIPQTGDARGGNTNMAAQLSNMLHHPITYVKVLFVSIISNMFSLEWLAGVNRGGFLALGYSGNVTQPLIEFLILGYVWLTDTYGNEEKEGECVSGDRQLDIKFKGAIIGCIVLCGILIFTALYIRFTEVGSLTIEGVQARYFLPVLGGLMIALQPSWLSNHQSKKLYQYGIISFQVAFLLYNIYVLMIVPGCV